MRKSVATMHHSMEAIELFNLKALGCHRLTCPAAPSLERITLDADCEVPNRAAWIDPARDENSASRNPARLDALSVRGLQVPPRHLQNRNGAADSSRTPGYCQ